MCISAWIWINQCISKSSLEKAGKRSQLSCGEFGEKKGWLWSLISLRTDYIPWLKGRPGMTWKKVQVSSILRCIVKGLQLWFPALFFNLMGGCGHFLKSAVWISQQLEDSAFSHSFAFSDGEKLEDTTRAEWPRFLAVLDPAGTKFPAEKILCLPWSNNGHVFKDQGGLGFTCLPGCFELCCCAPLSGGVVTRKELFFWVIGVWLSLLFFSVDLPPSL